jgi:hypothetical protein
LFKRLANGIPQANIPKLSLAYLEEPGDFVTSQMNASFKDMTALGFENIKITNIRSNINVS